MTKMTEREIYEGLKAGTLDQETINAFCDKKIAALDHRNEKAKERAAAKREAGDELMEAVFEALIDEPQTRADVTARIEGDEITVSKVGYRLSALVKAGRAVKEEVSVEGEDGKSKKVAAYRLA
jgi:hypothetical protein